MTLQAMTRAWAAVAARDRDGFLPRLPALLQRGETARHAIYGLEGRMLRLAIVEPATITPTIASLTPFVERAAAEDQSEIGPDDRCSPALFETINLGNVIECVGGTLSPETHAIFRDWIERIHATRDDADTSAFWSKYFTALAFDDKLTYRRGIPGPALDEALDPPSPGTKAGPNLRVFLRHLAAVVEHRAPYATIAAGWEEFLERFPRARDELTLDPGSLLWAARVVYHRIAGHPLGTVAQHLHDDLWRLAAADR
jgi:hypothetical protein